MSVLTSLRQRGRFQTTDSLGPHTLVVTGVAPPPSDLVDEKARPTPLVVVSAAYYTLLACLPKFQRVGSGVASSQQGSGRFGAPGQALPEPPTAVVQVHMCVCVCMCVEFVSETLGTKGFRSKPKMLGYSWASTPHVFHFRELHRRLWLALIPSPSPSPFVFVI